MNTKSACFVALSTLAALALVGCDTKAVKGHVETSNASPRDRALERWNLLIAHHAEQAYDFLSPGFRQTKSRDDYAKEMNERPLKWQKVSFISEECDGDTCALRLLIDYKLPMGGSVGTVNTAGPVKETWIKSDGKWYFLPDALQSSKLEQAH